MSPEMLQTVRGLYFDTVNTIQAYCDMSILQDAMTQCAGYNALLSKTVCGSDVWNMNNAHGKPITISEDTAAILKIALEMSAASKGAFDIAVGAATAMWNFKSGEPRLPDQDKLTEAIASADYTAIHLNGRVVSIPDGMQLDLGGIAKGHIADRIADYLRGRGLTNALLNFGGNVVAVGNKPDGSPWVTGLRTPWSETGNDFWAVVECSDNSLVTSAIYERGFFLNDICYHHILDPRTGWPVQNDLISVTALCRNSLLADAITTAMFVLGVKEGIRLAQKYDVQALFLEQNGNISKTDGFPVKFLLS